MIQKRFIPILIILIIVLFGILGYFFYTNGYLYSIIGNKSIFISPEPYPINTRPPETKNPKSTLSPSLDTSCKVDSECKLVIEDSWSNCSLGNNCQPVDYSKPMWIAVNSSWYDEIRNVNCPPKLYPAPGCFPRPINDRYYARCVKNVCQKAPSK